MTGYDNLLRQFSQDTQRNNNHDSLYDDNATMDYGLSDFDVNGQTTPLKNASNILMGMNKTVNMEDERENNYDIQLRKLLEDNKRENKEEKTQRNNSDTLDNGDKDNDDGDDGIKKKKESVSPLLKALKSDNKSALYTNMLLPSRKDQ